MGMSFLGRTTVMRTFLLPLIHFRPFVPRPLSWRSATTAATGVSSKSPFRMSSFACHCTGMELKSKQPARTEGGDESIQQEKKVSASVQARRGERTQAMETCNGDAWRFLTVSIVEDTSSYQCNPGRTRGVTASVMISTSFTEEAPDRTAIDLDASSEPRAIIHVPALDKRQAHAGQLVN